MFTQRATHTGGAGDNDNPAPQTVPLCACRSTESPATLTTTGAMAPSTRCRSSTRLAVLGSCLLCCTAGTVAAGTPAPQLPHLAPHGPALSPHSSLDDAQGDLVRAGRRLAQRTLNYYFDLGLDCPGAALQLAVSTQGSDGIIYTKGWTSIGPSSNPSRVTWSSDTPERWMHLTSGGETVPFTNAKGSVPRCDRRDNADFEISNDGSMFRDARTGAESVSCEGLGTPGQYARVTYQLLESTGQSTLLCPPPNATQPSVVPVVEPVAVVEPPPPLPVAPPPPSPVGTPPSRHCAVQSLRPRRCTLPQDELVGSLLSSSVACVAAQVAAACNCAR